MKPSISDQTKKLLDLVEAAEKLDIEIPHYTSDKIELDLFQRGIHIHSLEFVKDMDIFLIVLNNEQVIKDNISDYPQLKDLTFEDLKQYVLSEDKLGVQWKKQDVDFHLVGFIKKHIAAQSSMLKQQEASSQNLQSYLRQSSFISEEMRFHDSVSQILGHLFQPPGKKMKSA